MQDLKSLEGSTVQALIRFFDAKLVRDYRLHRVETCGIWVESQEYTDKILESLNMATAPSTFVAFVPWSEVGVIYGSAALTSLSEKAHGLR